MTAIADILAADLAATGFDADATETPAVAANHTSLAAVVTAIHVICEDREKQVVEQPDGQQTTEQFACYVQASELASPQIGETMTIGSELFAISGVNKVAAGAAWRLDLQRLTPYERSRGDYRLKR